MEVEAQSAKSFLAVWNRPKLVLQTLGKLASRLQTLDRQLNFFQFFSGRQPMRRRKPRVLKVFWKFGIGSNLFCRVRASLRRVVCKRKIANLKCPELSRTVGRGQRMRRRKPRVLKLSLDLPLLCRLSYEVRLSRQSNRRSNPEVVGSIPTEVKIFFLYLVWFLDSLY